MIEDRYDRSSTMITTQMLARTWHEALVDPTIAYARCDRLVHDAQVLELGDGWTAHLHLDGQHRGNLSTVSIAVGIALPSAPGTHKTTYGWLGSSATF